MYLLANPIPVHIWMTSPVRWGLEGALGALNAMGSGGGVVAGGLGGEGVLSFLGR